VIGAEADLEEQRRKLREELGRLDGKILRTGSSDAERLQLQITSVIGTLADVGSRQVEVAHDRLTHATKRLTFATWVLFFATVALVGVTVYEWLHAAR
jgi:hypothetical protein